MEDTRVVVGYGCEHAHRASVWRVSRGGEGEKDKGLIVWCGVHVWRDNRSCIMQCISSMSTPCARPSSATKISPKVSVRWLKSESVSWHDPVGVKGEHTAVVGVELSGGVRGERGAGEQKEGHSRGRMHSHISTPPFGFHVQHWEYRLQYEFATHISVVGDIWGRRTVVLIVNEGEAGKHKRSGRKNE